MTQNVFKTCDVCQAINIKTLIPRLKNIDRNAKIEVGCQNFCAIGRTKPFVLVNGIPIIANTEDEVISKVKDSLKERGKDV